MFTIIVYVCIRKLCVFTNTHTECLQTLCACMCLRTLCVRVYMRKRAFVHICKYVCRCICVYLYTYMFIMYIFCMLQSKHTNKQIFVVQAAETKTVIKTDQQNNNLYRMNVVSSVIKFGQYPFNSASNLEIV